MRKMKDSGIEWIGEIPEVWEIEKIKHMSTIIRGGSPRPIEEYYSVDDTGYNWIKIGDTVKGSKYINSTKCKIIESGLNKTRFVRKGTLILTNSMSFGEPYILNIDGCIHDGWVAFFDLRNIHKEFFYYCLISTSCRQQFETISDGGVVQNLNIDKIGNSFVAFPEISEQQKISAFLDRICSEIDSVIEKTKATIEEYKSLKQSVITQAVTKGIRKGRKMKDSGIEWIGEIPEEWEIRKLFRAIEQIGDIDHYMPESVDKGVPYLMTGDLSENISDIELNNCKQISDNDYKTLSEKITISKGDVIFARYATIGTVCYVDVDTPFLVSYSCLTIKPMKKCLNGKYLFYYLKSDTFFEDIKQYIKSNTQSNVGLDSMGKAKIILPNIDEQQEIVMYLDEKCSEIDKLIAKKEQLLTELENYKKSVIYEYVTGKKEVVDTSVVFINPLTEQALLLCKIKDYLGDELKGRIQALKCLYLIESFVGINFNTQYFRYEHGPYTHNIVNIEKCCMDNGWLTVSKNEHYEYHVGNNHCYCDEYDRLFGTNNSDIEKVLSFIKGMKTSEAERVATLFAVWNDMIIEGKTFPSDSEIIYEVRNNWTPNKAHSPESTWQNTLDKMKRAGIIPKGYGLHTMKKENENEQL